jgi:cell division protein FtsA
MTGSPPNKAMSTKPFLAVGLDAGSRYTRAVICTLENNRMRFLGCGAVESQGWSKSRIADQQSVSQCILSAVQQAETAAQTLVESVTVGFGGATVRGANTRSKFELGRPREISQADVNTALKRATKVQLQEDRMILQLFPQDFVVDDHPGHRDPRKMLAYALEANVHIITASEKEHNSLVGAVNQAHLSVDETIFEAIASCYGAVLPEERYEGLACLDMGAHSSELVVYYGDSLQLASTIAIGGDHFTRDIAHFLKISFEDASLVKEVFGSAVSVSTANNSYIEIPAPEGRNVREANRRELNRIIEARAQELFDLLKKDLMRVGMQRALTSGLVLTGGGSHLHGICDIAEHVLDCQIRLGLGVGVQDWPEDLDMPSWSTALGLSMYSARLRTQVDLERQSIGLLGRILR